MMKISGFWAKLSRKGKIASGCGAGVLLFAAWGLWWWLGDNGDRAADIRGGQANLRQLHQAVTLFQSEKYFARPPKDLEELWTVSKIPCKTVNPVDGRDMNVEVRPLVPGVRVFRSPSLRRGLTAYFACDYLLAPYYQTHMPSNAIIMLDKPGNFKTGGNVVFYDGRIRFLRMNEAEYRRFAEAVMNRNDRDFVRQKCGECSISGYKK